MNIRRMENQKTTSTITSSIRQNTAGSCVHETSCADARNKFEVGKEYEANDPGLDPIKVIRRTAKCIIVDNGTSKWRMVVKIDEEGDEYVVDSSVPKKWQEMFRYSARWNV